MSKVKVVLRVPTMGAARGETVEVDSAEIADALVANGTARRVKPGPKPEPATEK